MVFLIMNHPSITMGSCSFKVNATTDYTGGRREVKIGLYGASLYISKIHKALTMNKRSTTVDYTKTYFTHGDVCISLTHFFSDKFDEMLTQSDLIFIPHNLENNDLEAMNYKLEAFGKSSYPHYIILVGFVEYGIVDSASPTALQTAKDLQNLVLHIDIYGIKHAKFVGVSLHDRTDNIKNLLDMVVKMTD
jgi:hypothetical protein